MERTSNNCPKPEIVARSGVKTRREDRCPINHGFFNSRNAGLGDVPRRAWGRLPVVVPPVHGSRAELKP